MIVSKTVASTCVMVVLLAVPALAVNIETVPVGNPGNAGELSGEGAGGFGPDRICGRVDYTYNIGKYEVTAGEYCSFLNAVAATDTYGLYNTYMSMTSYGSGIARTGGGTAGNPYTYRVDAAFVNRPVTYVSWGDAARFANWLHNGQPTGEQGADTTETGAYTLNGAMTLAELLAITRNADWKWAITSEDEWYKAAYYDPASSSYYDYPTSSDLRPGRDLSDVSGNNANYYGIPYPIQSPHYTTVVGEFQSSDSPCGTFDQGGNVLEWNEAVIGSYRGFRGGSFSNGGSNLRGSGRYYHNPTNELGHIGFRVSEVPEPEMIVLLALAGVGILRMRRA